MSGIPTKAERERRKILLEQGLKECTKCLVVKSIDEFYKSPYRNSTACRSHCKMCHIDNTDNGKKSTEYYHNNREQRIEYQNKWIKNNKNKIRVGRRAYRKKKKLIDPCYKLREGVSKAIGAALKRKGGTKNGNSILNYLPYTIEELKEHLESQFQEGMSWDNHGVDGWHIDHIIPQSKLLYDSMDHPNFQKCWALENLQPLWAKDNLSKSNKIL